MMKKIIALVFFLLAFFASHSQNLEIGLFGGASYYHGELNPSVPFVSAQPAFGVLGRYSNGTRWAYRAAITQGRLFENGARARVSSARSKSMNQDITDISLLAEFNFFDYFTGSKKEYMTPYIFGGLSLFMPSSSYSTSSDVPISMPFGVGFKYSLGKRIAMSVEWKMHKTLHDGLEGFGLQGWESDRNDKDWFNFTGISLTYMFNLQKRQACNSYKDVAF